jgi:hypothetical protein
LLPPCLYGRGIQNQLKIIAVAQPIYLAYGGFYPILYIYTIFFRCFFCVVLPAACPACSVISVSPYLSVSKKIRAIRVIRDYNSPQTVSFFNSKFPRTLIPNSK